MYTRYKTIALMVPTVLTRPPRLYTKSSCTSVKTKANGTQTAADLFRAHCSSRVSSLSSSVVALPPREAEAEVQRARAESAVAEAARSKAEAEAARSKAEAEAARSKAEAEAEVQRARAESAVAEAAQSKAEAEAARSKAEAEMGASGAVSGAESSDAPVLEGPKSNIKDGHLPSITSHRRRPSSGGGSVRPEHGDGGPAELKHSASGSSTKMKRKGSMKRQSSVKKQGGARRMSFDPNQDSAEKAMASAKDQEHAIVCRALLDKKLADKDAELEMSESIDLLGYCLKMGEEAAKELEGKEMIVLIGPTGAGKSTLTNYLAGCTFSTFNEDGVEVLYVLPKSEGGAMDEVTPIGHSAVSKTFLPEIFAAPNSFVFCDCPGFLDSRGAEINIANAVNIKAALTHAKGVRVVAVVDHASISAVRGQAVKELVDICKHLFESPANILKHRNSISLCVSKVERKFTVENIRSALLKLARNDQVMQVLADRVFICDPLECPEGEVRMRRDECLRHLKDMPLITEPAKIFKTVLNCEDEARLGDIVFKIEGAICKLLDNADFWKAASMFHEVERLRVIDHVHVVRLLGLCKDKVGQFFRAMEARVKDECSYQRFEAAQEQLDVLYTACKHFRRDMVLGGVEGLQAWVDRLWQKEREREQREIQDREAARNAQQQIEELSEMLRKREEATLGQLKQQEEEFKRMSAALEERMREALKKEEASKEALQAELRDLLRRKDEDIKAAADEEEASRLGVEQEMLQRDFQARLEESEKLNREIAAKHQEEKRAMEAEQKKALEALQAQLKKEQEDRATAKELHEKEKREREAAKEKETAAAQKEVEADFLDFKWEDGKGSNCHVSSDGLVASTDDDGWVRGDRGVEPGQKAKWVVKLSKEDGGRVHYVAVVDEKFKKFDDTPGRGFKGAWNAQNTMVFENGKETSGSGRNFREGDIVTCVMDRSTGGKGTLTMSVKGKQTVRIKSLSESSTLYPAVAMCHKDQTFILLPKGMPAAGMRVRRGPDWRWGNQDGGSGKEGTVKARDPGGSKGWVRVEWDKGSSNNYRFGADNSFDLDLTSNAPGAKASVVELEDEDKSKRPIKIGMRVRRGPDWKWHDQDGGKGKEGVVVGELDEDEYVRVKWDAGGTNMYRWGSDKKYDLEIITELWDMSKESTAHCRNGHSMSLQSSSSWVCNGVCGKGSFPASKERQRCSICDYDLCEDCYKCASERLSTSTAPVGSILRVTQHREVASIPLSNLQEVYLGCLGEVTAVSDKGVMLKTFDGNDHGVEWPWHAVERPEKVALKMQSGALVRIINDADRAEKACEGHGGWNSSGMGKLLGHEGTAADVLEDKVRIKIKGASNCVWGYGAIDVLQGAKPSAVLSSKELSSKMRVRIVPDVEQAKKGVRADSRLKWEEAMGRFTGQVGKVLDYDDTKVQLKFSCRSTVWWGYGSIEPVAEIASRLKPKDKVRIVVKDAKQGKKLLSGNGGWVEGMAKHLGKLADVVEAKEKEVRLRFDDDTWFWPYACIEKSKAVGTVGKGSVEDGQILRVSTNKEKAEKSCKDSGCGFSSQMPKFLGRVGRVVKSDDVSAQLEHSGGTYWWAYDVLEDPGLIESVLRVGDSVRIVKDKKQAKKSLKEMGGWVDSMGQHLGKTGKVKRVEEGKGAHVKMSTGKQWFWCWEAIDGIVVDEKDKKKSKSEAIVPPAGWSYAAVEEWCGFRNSKSGIACFFLDSSGGWALMCCQSKFHVVYSDASVSADDGSRAKGVLKELDEDSDHHLPKASFSFGGWSIFAQSGNIFVQWQDRETWILGSEIVSYLDYRGGESCIIIKADGHTHSPLDKAKEAVGISEVPKVPAKVPTRKSEATAPPADWSYAGHGDCFGFRNAAIDVAVAFTEGSNGWAWLCHKDKQQQTVFSANHCSNTDDARPIRVCKKLKENPANLLPEDAFELGPWSIWHDRTNVFVVHTKRKADFWILGPKMVSFFDDMDCKRGAAIVAADGFKESPVEEAKKAVGISEPPSKIPDITSKSSARSDSDDDNSESGSSSSSSSSSSSDNKSDSDSDGGIKAKLHELLRGLGGEGSDSSSSESETDEGAPEADSLEVRFSSSPKGEKVKVSDDGRLVSGSEESGICGWARSKKGVEPGSVKSWTIKTSESGGGKVHYVGLMGEDFSGDWDECGGMKQTWWFQNDRVWSNGKAKCSKKQGRCFKSGDKVTLVLDRREDKNTFYLVNKGKHKAKIKDMPKKGTVVSISQFLTGKKVCGTVIT